MLQNPLRDNQLEPPSGYCIYCDGELYGDEYGICTECLKRLDEESIFYEED